MDLNLTGTVEMPPQSLSIAPIVLPVLGILKFVL